MVWYKDRIERLIPPFRQMPPHSRWNRDLFASFPAPAIANELQRGLVLVGWTYGVWERIDKLLEHREASLASDPLERSAYNGVKLLSQLYACLVYMRGRIFDGVAGQLDPATPESDLWQYFAGPNAEYRLIRNALAHGTFDLRQTDVEFRDELRKWKGCVTYERLQLDCLLMFDFLMSAFESKRGTQGPVA